MFESGSEGRLVGKGHEWMYICEEIVNEEFEGIERAYGLG